MNKLNLRSKLILLAALVMLAFIFSACSLIVIPTQSDVTTESGSPPETTSPSETETTATTESTTEATTIEETTAETVPPTPTPAAGQTTYTVKAGDNLYRISQLFALPVDRIALANDITNPDLIYTGQVLVIPIDDSDPQPDYSSLDNTGYGWWYQVPDPLGQDLPPIIPARAAGLAQKYNIVWQLPFDGEKVVYITMDAGYEYGTNTTKILDIAAAKDVKINFFVTGSFIALNPRTVRRMVDEGHLVSNHTEDHLNQPKALAESVYSLQYDVIVAERRFAELTGKSFAPYLRPPEGVYSERSLAVLRDIGYKAVFWSFAYSDWRTDLQPDPDEAYAKIMGQLHNGSVLLLHTVSNTNVQILDRLIDGIRERGYSIELLPDN